jgi:hypothetical protein
MDHRPCSTRLFPHQINTAGFASLYLRWFQYLTERLGVRNIALLWEKTFAKYDDTLLRELLSSGWNVVPADQGEQAAKINPAQTAETLQSAGLHISAVELNELIRNTPPIPQIAARFADKTVQKEITAYDALHLRFDSLAFLAEGLIEQFGKQGELIVYDLVVADRLASAQTEKGSVEQFIVDFTSEPESPNLFTAGLEAEIVHRTSREVRLDVLECEWARYFRARHPAVGYLMACSTDEVAYQSFNQNLRLQRTQTLMEGGAKCDFWIFAADDKE